MAVAKPQLGAKKFEICIVNRARYVEPLALRSQVNFPTGADDFQVVHDGDSVGEVLVVSRSVDAADR